MVEFAKNRDYDKALDRALLYQDESKRFKFFLLIADAAGEHGDFDRVEEIVKMALGLDAVSLDKNEHWILINVLDYVIHMRF